jgi:hypothetical protein
MPQIRFTNTLANPASTTPETLNVSLTSKGVVLEELGANVKFLVFQDTPLALTTNFQTLSTPEGTKFRADTAYSGAQFGVIFKDNSSTIFTLLTGGTNGANRVTYILQTVASNGYNSQSLADFQRLWNLNG